MAKKSGRTYEWQGRRIVDVDDSAPMQRAHTAARPGGNRLGLNEAILLLSGSVIALVVCAPLLGALLYVAYGVIFAK